MDRRTVLTFAASYVPVSGLLSACGGGGSNSAPQTTPTNPTTSTSFAYGARLKSKAELGATPKIYGKASAAALPSFIDNSTNGFLPPIGSQGQQPSCVAWAVGYATGTYLAAQKSSAGSSAAAQQASPADLYAKLQAIAPTQCGQGTSLSDACGIMVKDKVASLQSSPYNENACPASSDQNTFGFAGAQPLNLDAGSLKADLAAGKILPFAIQVPSDFQDWGFGPSKNGVYQTAGALLNEGHAMTLVGYDDSRSAFKVMNSWGRDFGDNGFFWFGYTSFSAVTSEVWSCDGLAPGPVNPSPSPSPAPATIDLLNLTATTQPDYYNGVSLLYLNFILDNPMFVATVTLGFSDTFGVGVAPYQTPPYPVSVWVVQSFVQFWLRLPTLWAPGTYSLTLSGTTNAGQAVTVSGSTVYGG